MLTAADVGAMLGISPRTVYAIPEDRLPRYRFGASGGAVRFDRADVDAYRIATSPPERPMLTAREVRALMRASRAAEADGSDPILLPPELQALLEKRFRNMRCAPWADKSAIRRVYAEAKSLTAATGIAHHVDHIIPLQGEFVSGLHVEQNLRVITATENIKKRNKVAD